MAGVRIRAIPVALVALLLAACTSPVPSPDPAKGVRVRNESERAVMVSTGSPLDHAAPILGARPCGGELTIQLHPTDFQEDGRLLLFFAIDPSEEFDQALAKVPGDPSAMPGRFQASLIWSDGTLAGRLPVTLTIAPDLSVTDEEMSASPAAVCVPRR